jgi:hypothetical protein
MNCYTHTARAAVGICAACGKAVCLECVGADTPRLVCAACVARGTAPPVGWARGGYYGVGWEYRSSIALGSWPLVHLCFGRDPVTYRPRVAKGVIAVGNAAVGVLAIGGAAFGLVTVGGLSIGLVGAVGGAALGAGLSIGGFAVGTIAIGGAAVGFMYAIGGGAVAPAVLSAGRCDQAALDVARRWLQQLPASCR